MALSNTRMSDLTRTVHDFVFHYMSQSAFDASHDFSHVLRVVRLAQQIYSQSSPDFQSHCNPSIITLLAYLHDVGDKKYSSPTTGNPGETQQGPVETFLLCHDVPQDLASLLQLLVTNVSFSNEKKFPDKVASLCATHPELAIIQDTDRLDAIGAIGIARAFTYGIAKKPQDGWTGVLQHYGEKLVSLEEGMKTEIGKRLANVRAERLKTFFEEWWVDEDPTIEKLPLDSNARRGL